MLTSKFWKRATLGAGLMAVLLTGVPDAVAEGRFRLPYGDGAAGPVGPVGQPRDRPRLHGPHARLEPLRRPVRPDARPAERPSLGRPAAVDDLGAQPGHPGRAVRLHADRDQRRAGADHRRHRPATSCPNGVRLVQTAASQGVCSLAQQYVRCALGTLDGGRNATVTITVNAVRAGTIYNTASAMGREYDPYEGNNTATATTDVQSGGSWAADLGVANAVDRSHGQSRREPDLHHHRDQRRPGGGGRPPT